MLCYCCSFLRMVRYHLEKGRFLFHISTFISPPSTRVTDFKPHMLILLRKVLFNVFSTFFKAWDYNCIDFFSVNIYLLI